MAGKNHPGGRRSSVMKDVHHDTRPVCRTDGPPVDVIDWRRCRLTEAGFAEPLASSLAEGVIDVHALLSLVDRGCPPELAARILAPMGSGSA